MRKIALICFLLGPFSLVGDEDGFFETNDAYIKRCEKDGVLIPPDFETAPPGDGWKKIKTLNSDELQSDPGKEPPNTLPPKAGGELYSWQKGETLCYAFLRYQKGPFNPFKTGIICYNEKKNKVCTFDREEDDAPENPTRSDNCLTCHSGRTPWLGTAALADVLPTPPKKGEPFLMVNPHAPKADAKPGVTVFWEKNNVVTTGTCTRCHAMQEVNARSCSARYFPRLVGNSPSMPPAGATNQDIAEAKTILTQCCEFAADYRNPSDAIKDACAKLNKKPEAPPPRPVEPVPVAPKLPVAPAPSVPKSPAPIEAPSPTTGSPSVKAPIVATPISAQ